MKSYQLHIIIHVPSYKYREYLNLVERHMADSKPSGCQTRMICQSIENNNVFDIRETWLSLENLKFHLKTPGFRAFLGALKLLTDVQQFQIQECNEIDEVMELI